MFVAEAGSNAPSADSVERFDRSIASRYSGCSHSKGLSIFSGITCVKKPRETLAMKAIVEINGKQYPIQEGRYVVVDLYQAKEDDALTLDNVVFIQAGEASLIGAPYVEGATIRATVKRHFKGSKVLVYKMRCKKGYRRKNGHRQNYTELMIQELSFPGKDKILAQYPDEPLPEPKVTREPTLTKAATTAPVTAEPAEQSLEPDTSKPKAPKAKAKTAEDTETSAEVKAPAKKSTKSKKATEEDASDEIAAETAPIEEATED